MAIKMLIGGSPCTKWSIAQKNDRETEPKGEGWELFKNYLIAKEKFRPDLFLYENNKSAAQPIKDQISYDLGVDLMHINSALVSAQNRERFYAFNWSVEQPKDRGILLRDILDPSAYGINYELKTVGAGWRGRKEEDGKYHKRYESANMEKANALTTCRTDSMIAEPVRIGDIGSTAQAHRVYSCDGKARTLIANAGGQGGKAGLYTTPIKVGEIGNGGQGNRIYSVDGKSVAQTAKGGGLGSNTGLYAYPATEGKPIYEVKDGLITIKGKQYPIKLADGYYVIRKLTVTECCRLQTLPDDYCRAVSNSQAYKGLGNGWTAEVIIHILNGALKNVPRDEEIIVLSMYDGIGTGRYCFDKMGFTNVRYFAYEVDRYAQTVAMSNYPDIIQCGDAFAVRHNELPIVY